MEYEMEDDGPTILAVAVNENKNSKHALKWALNKFIPEGINLIKLLYVYPKLAAEPTPTRDEASAHKKRDWKGNAILFPYIQICSEKQVEAEPHVIQSDDVAAAISAEIVKCAINKLVIGSSSRSALVRKIKGAKTSRKISETVPSFCTVYVVSRGGKLSAVHNSKSYCSKDIIDDRSSSSISSSCRSSHESSAHSENTDADSSLNIHLYSPSLQNQRSQALKAVNQNLIDAKSNSGTIYHSSNLSLSIDEDAISSKSTSIDIQNMVSRNSSCSSTDTDYQSRNSDQASPSCNITCTSIPDNQDDVCYELERLRIEVQLQHLQEICKKVKIEKFHADKKMTELRELSIEEKCKLDMLHLREIKLKEQVLKESEAREEAEEEAEFVKECARREVLDKDNADVNADRVAEEKKMLERAHRSCDQQQYKKFEWEDIVSATSSFSEDLKIGTGANGAVYKGRLHHTDVAIKVLQSNEVHRTKHFQQELEVLGRIRHPHLLLLLGACPDHGCLVYEYMDNGSLSDRLKCKKNTPPLRWFHRYRIAWEIASALFFLHKSKPEPIVHRDMKPANILLDHNLVAKIGDVGLSTLIPANSSMSSVYKNTAPVGTICYIDPEYQRTGRVSPKSDVYSFGMVILQLLTAKSPMGLPHTMETAINKGGLEDILDPKAGKWPVEETKQLAQLALGCLEFCSRDRPDLQTTILPMLENLKKVADVACDPVHRTAPPPNHFICPIFQEVMEEPCVAADGYTYDKKAIDMWLSMNDKSPMTNLQLPNKTLIPNHTLLSAIKDWKLINE